MKKWSVVSKQWPAFKFIKKTAHCALLTVHSSQQGVSSMMVLILVVLLIIVGWEIGQFASQYSKTGQEALEAAAIRNKACIGSNTTYDCYDQDEGTDFVDN